MLKKNNRKVILIIISVFISIIFFGYALFSILSSVLLETNQSIGRKGDSYLIELMSLVISGISAFISLIGVIITGILSYLVYRFTKNIALKEEKEKFLSSYFNIKASLKNINERILSKLEYRLASVGSIENKWKVFNENADLLQELSDKVKKDIKGPLVCILAYQIAEFGNFNPKENEKLLNCNTNNDEKITCITECVENWMDNLQNIKGALSLYEQKLDKQYEEYLDKKSIGAFKYIEENLY